jgi:hypothetical protein
MAIDYKQPITNTRRDLSPLQEGIQAWAERSNENIQLELTRFNRQIWERMLKPFSDAAISDVGDYDFNQLANANFSTALRQYKNTAMGTGTPIDRIEGITPLSPKAKRLAEKMGFFDPVAFRQKYDQEKQLGVSLLEKKLEAYKVGNALDDDDMRKFFQKKKIQSFALENFSPAGTMYEFGKPEGKTWTESIGSFLGKQGELAVKDPLKFGVTRGLPIAGGAYALSRWGPSMEGATKTKLAQPWNVNQTRSNLKGMREKLKAMYKSAGGPGANTSAAHKLKAQIKAAENHIKRVTELADKAGVKIPATSGGRLLSGAKNIGVWMGAPIAAEKITKALGGDEKTGRVAGQSISATMSSLAATTNELIRRKGMRWFITKLAQKGGAGIAARLLGKTGLGLIGGVASGGAMSLFMGGLAINDIRLLVKAINDLSKES